MAAGAPVSLKAEDLLARVAPNRVETLVADRVAREAKRAEMREKFPLMAEMVDVFRAFDATRDPYDEEDKPACARPVFATNAAGETWGAEPHMPSTIVKDGNWLIERQERIQAAEASWRKFYAKKKDDRRTYNERAQRAIKPHTGRID